jgi:uncharacterized membrane protein
MIRIGRLQSFSDAVIAIIVTIMVIQFKVPSGTDIFALKDIIPTFLAYLLSFSVVLGIYWNNNHNLIHPEKPVTTDIMWANLHLLFWLSLVPFATTWIGLHYSNSFPTAFYALLMLLCAIAYNILESAIERHHGKNAKLAGSFANIIKRKVTQTLYLFAIGAAFISPWISDLLFVVVSVVWLIPDEKIKRSTFLLR